VSLRLKNAQEGNTTELLSWKKGGQVRIDEFTWIKGQHFFPLIYTACTYLYFVSYCFPAAKTNFPLPYYEAEVEVYKEYMARACGQLPRGSAAVIREVEAYTLPRNRVATADEKKRSAIIYGETLRQALEG